MAARRWWEGWGHGCARLVVVVVDRVELEGEEDAEMLTMESPVVAVGPEEAPGLEEGLLKIFPPSLTS